MIIFHLPLLYIVNVGSYEKQNMNAGRQVGIFINIYNSSISYKYYTRQVS